MQVHEVNFLDDVSGAIAAALARWQGSPFLERRENTTGTNFMEELRSDDRRALQRQRPALLEGVGDSAGAGQRTDGRPAVFQSNT